MVRLRCVPGVRGKAKKCVIKGISCLGEPTAIALCDPARVAATLKSLVVVPFDDALEFGWVGGMLAQTSHPCLFLVGELVWSVAFSIQKPSADVDKGSPEALELMVFAFHPRFQAQVAIELTPEVLGGH